MCYNYKTSIISFSLGMVSAAIALICKRFELGMLILFYSQMQFSEAIIWRAIDTNNVELNKKGTRYGKHLLATHNIAIGLGIIMREIYRKRTLTAFTLLPLTVGIVFYGIITKVYRDTPHQEVTYPLKKCETRSCQHPGNRLQWPFPHSWYIYSFIISIIMLIVYIEPVNTKIYLTTIFSILFALSYFVHPSSVGSVWCFSTAIMAPVIVGGDILLNAK